MSEPEPAFAAHEWDDVLRHPILSISEALDGPGGVLVSVLTGPRDRNKALARVIASANAALPDSDPAKITRERIALLRECEQSANSVYPLTLSDADVASLRAFIDALARYLPPA